MMSVGKGGGFGSGFLSGGVSSGISSATSGWSPTGMIAAGGVSGGIGSAIGGGSFWDGLGQGLITSGLNHAAHSFTDAENPLIRWLFKKFAKRAFDSPFKEMTTAQRRAFQHSYSRHHEELGLPPWRESTADELIELFNKKVLEIRKAGVKQRTHTWEKRWHNGKKEWLDITHPQ
jgi:hypothetical protein